jgi:hypothetical protein
MMTVKQPQDVSVQASVNALTRHQRRQLSVVSLGIDERTIRRAYLNPASVRESTLLRIAEAARTLGLPRPVAVAGLQLRSDGENP